MIFVAVCEDEPVIAEQLAQMTSEILRVRAEPFCLDRFSSAEALLKSRRRFDILLLDIALKGMDGMEAARRLRERGGCAPVFVTGRAERVFEAFDVDAAGYLLKPVAKDKLERTLDKLLARRDRDAGALYIRQGHYQKRIESGDLLYCEARNHQVTLYTSQGCENCYVRLDKLEQELKHPNFFRCHRGFLVNLHYVTELRDSYAVLTTGERVPIAARRRAAFLQALLLCKQKGVVP